MKTIGLIFGILLQSLITSAQVWAPAGATWHYDWIEMAVDGYAKISFVNDSVVGGRAYKVLKVEQHTYNWITGTFTNAVLGYEYTYLDNNVVYYYRYGQFFKLYDFNSVAGSSWTVAGWDQNNPCDSLGSVVVDSTGTTAINGFSLKYLKVSPGPNSEWEFMDRIIERIGSLGYMFPGPNCVIDIPGPGQLRCYYDDAFGLYKRSGFPPTCDFIVGVDDLSNDNNRLKIYPVPATTAITAEISKPVNGKVTIVISDIAGRTVKSLQTEGTRPIIDIKDLAEGLYLIKLMSSEGISYSRMIKKTP